ncbi:MAG: pectin esterase, partial [Tannerella sp.]|nr:pectin esterase [Tannerella sp.]
MKKVLLFLSGFFLVLNLTVDGQKNRGDRLPFDAVVDISGSGSYTSVQAAVDAAPENRTSPWRIFIKNGSYKETVFIPENKPFIHLIGQNKEKTVIHEKLHVGALPNPESKWYKNDSAAWISSIHNPQSPAYRKQGSVVRVDATDFYAENISFVNDWGVEEQTGPQALAIHINNDRSAFYNCKFRSFQDTW